MLCSITTTITAAEIHYLPAQPSPVQPVKNRNFALLLLSKTAAYFAASLARPCRVTFSGPTLEFSLYLFLWW
jgi:hypothetical protein